MRNYYATGRKVDGFTSQSRTMGKHDDGDGLRRRLPAALALFIPLFLSFFVFFSFCCLSSICCFSFYCPRHHIVAVYSLCKKPRSARVDWQRAWIRNRCGYDERGTIKQAAVVLCISYSIKKYTLHAAAAALYRRLFRTILPSSFETRHRGCATTDDG